MTHTTSHLAVLGLSNCREVQLSTGRLAITRYSVNANAMTALRYAGPSLWRAGTAAVCTQKNASFHCRATTSVQLANKNNVIETKVQLNTTLYTVPHRPALTGEQRWLPAASTLVVAVRSVQVQLMCGTVCQRLCSHLSHWTFFDAASKLNSVRAFLQLTLRLSNDFTAA